MLTACFFKFDFKRGFSVAELEQDTVVAEFQRHLKDLPLCSKTTVQCDAKQRFRFINGTCNNLKNPTWGMSRAAQRRLLPAAYGVLKCKSFHHGALVDI
ncbi:hypothetical protein DPMN_186340 [Dreissena polymorpha]|uniref:Uncharacterized protein n=1 Tax=Dreissena polymorpha TaxID=45954 RepID=A0A9D4DNK2_DREPO|nr:hypothetical protein DPMN_186340 [Dreissena polymorpha]